MRSNALPIESTPPSCYHNYMVSNELLQKILNLDEPDREYVRNLITASLSDGLPPQLSPDDIQMLMQRIEKYDQNPDALVPWQQVKARLAEQRAKR